MILPRILDAGDKYKIMTIFFGTNDAFNNLQGVPLARYGENIDKLVKLAKSHSIKVIVISPAVHVAELRAQLGGEPLGAEKTNGLYAAEAKSVATKNNVGFVDLFTKFLEHELPVNKLISDGIHFTPEGYKVLFDELMKEISDKYPEESPENIPVTLKLWGDLIQVQDREKMELYLFSE